MNAASSEAKKRNKAFDALMQDAELADRQSDEQNSVGTAQPGRMKPTAPVSTGCSRPIPLRDNGSTLLTMRWATAAAADFAEGVAATGSGTGGAQRTASMSIGSDECSSRCHHGHE